MLLLAGPFAAVGQNVRLEVRIVDITKQDPEIRAEATVCCDALDTALYLTADSSGRIAAMLPKGRCLVDCAFCPLLVLDLQRDTVVDGTDPTHLYHPTSSWPSRHHRDSVLRVREAELKADLQHVDTLYGMPMNDPYYFYLAYLYDSDLHFPLPRWRTFSRDTALHYFRYCYHQDPRRYDYLYYPIRQLEHALGQKPDRRVRPPKTPDGRWVTPRPEVPADWLDDTATSLFQRFSRAQNYNDNLAVEFNSLGEPSLVYPLRRKPAVRILYYGGLGNNTTLRVEDGRLHFATCSESFHPEEASQLERWSVKLTRAELDTLAVCIDSLRLLGDRDYLDDGMAIDAQTVHIEYSGPDGYRNVICFNPERHPETAPLYFFLDRLWRHYTHRLSFPIVSALTGKDIYFAHVTLTGKNYRNTTTPDIGKPTHFYAPEGKYTLRIDFPEYEPYERTVRLRGDTLLDTLRIEHRRIDLRVAYSANQRALGPMLLYIGGVDTAVVEENAAWDSRVDNHECLFRNVPAGVGFFIAEKERRAAGHYHSKLQYFRREEDEETDTLDLTLDNSRCILPTKVAKDRYLDSLTATLQGDAFRLGQLYYNEFPLYRMPTWQTYPHAADSAYRYLLPIYQSDPRRYNYLYYPLRQLDDFLHLHGDSVLKAPPPYDSLQYLPLPTEDFYYFYYENDYLASMLDVAERSRRYAELLTPMDEPSLLVPSRQGPALRYHWVDHHGGSVYCRRIENDTLYDKELFSTFGLTAPFDSTIDQDPNHYPDSLIVHKRALTAAERDTLTTLLRAVDDENISGFLGQRFGLSPVLIHFEYILDGRFHHFMSLHNHDDSPNEPSPAVNALRKWVSTLLE